jgi:hypothetical protein
MAATPILFRSTVPTIDLVENLSPKYIVTESPQEFRVVQYPATSFSQSYINWNIIPPSPETIFSRYIRVTLPVEISITGTNTGGGGSPTVNVINTWYAGFCAYPLHQIISTLTITFNNQAITIKPSQIIDKLMSYTLDRDIQKSTMSTTPSYPDHAGNYNQIIGSTTSEFIDYSGSVDHISRGSFPINFTNNPVVTPGNSATAIFTAEITEPLMINPLIFDMSWWRRAGITQITNLQVNITLDPYAMQHRLWRHDPKDLVQYSNISVTIRQPSLALIYFTLPTYMSVPPSISYPYAAVQNYIYTFSQIDNTAVTTQTVTSNTIQFQSIPHRVYISMSVSNNNKTNIMPDFFFPITNVNITWGNKTGILSTLTQKDLYLLCIKNGLRQSWPMFYGRRIVHYNGTANNNASAPKLFNGPSAALCFNFGEDIPLLSEDYPGKQGTWNFQVQCTFTNTLAENFSTAAPDNYPVMNVLPQMDIIVVYHGAMTITKQSVTLNTGLVPPGAPIEQLTKVSFPQETDMYSGGKFDLGSILSAIPGRILRGLSGLVSGLLGPEKEDEHPVKKIVRQGVKYLPSMVKQLRGLPQEVEEVEEVEE